MSQLFAGFSRVNITPMLGIFVTGYFKPRYAEGVLDELLENPIPDSRILCVPFIDYDGVIDGDQGKERGPHDHNRDYLPLRENSIYPECIAIMDYVIQNKCHYAC